MGAVSRCARFRVSAAIGFVLLCDLCDSARAMKPNEITAQIVDAAYRIHTKLGPGLLDKGENLVSLGKESRAESQRAQSARMEPCAVREPVDMAIPPKTARSREGFHPPKFTIKIHHFGRRNALPAKLFSLL